jgi:hypothetical protein
MAGLNKKEKAVKGIKHQGQQTALMDTINKGPGLLPGPLLIYDFKSRRLLRMTRIVLPSWPMTPNGKSSN